MRRVNVHEAKRQLSKLLEDVEGGERVVIARARSTRDIAHGTTAFDLADGTLPELAIMTASGHAPNLDHRAFPEQASIAARLRSDTI